MATAGDSKAKMAKKQIHRSTYAVPTVLLITSMIIGGLIYGIHEIEHFCTPVQEDSTAQDQHTSGFFQRPVTLFSFATPANTAADDHRTSEHDQDWHRYLCIGLRESGLPTALKHSFEFVKLSLERSVQMIQETGEYFILVVSEGTSDWKIWNFLTPVVSFMTVTALTIGSCYVMKRKRKEKRGVQVLDLSMDGSYVSDASFEGTDDVTPSCSNPFSNAATPSKKPPVKGVSSKSIVSWTVRWVFVVLVGVVIVSIPWEFLRLYHKAVAARASKVLQGVPPECEPQTMTFLASLRSFLAAQFSWGHGLDPCHQYHYALLVDPMWEVAPLLVVSSVVTRCVLHPVELTCSALGRGMRAFFSEVPAQWQPLVMLVAVVTVLLLVLALTRYRLVIPLLLRLEPKTPVTSPDTRGQQRRSEHMALMPGVNGQLRGLYDQRRSYLDSKDSVGALKVCACPYEGSKLDDIGLKADNPTREVKGRVQYSQDERCPNNYEFSNNRKYFRNESVDLKDVGFTKEFSVVGGVRDLPTKYSLMFRQPQKHSQSSTEIRNSTETPSTLSRSSLGRDVDFVKADSEVCVRDPLKAYSLNQKSAPTTASTNRKKGTPKTKSVLNQAENHSQRSKIAKENFDRNPSLKKKPASGAGGGMRRRKGKDEDFSWSPSAIYISDSD